VLTMVRITRQDLEDLTNLEQKNTVSSDYISALRYLSSGKFADLSLNEQVQRVESNTMLDKYTIMFLIKLRSMQNLQQAETTHSEWQQRLGNVDDKNLQSLGVELLQNALDIEATEVSFKFTDTETLSFTHNGRKWKINELSAVDAFLSTKKGDVRTIGQFGVGLKYWYHHFETFQVIFHDTELTHRLNWQRGFKPTECFYENEPRGADNKDGETQFVFSKLCYEEEVVQKREEFEKISKGEYPLLSDRIIQSMPNLRKDNDNFSLTINTLESNILNTISITKDEQLLFAKVNNSYYLEIDSYHITDRNLTTNGYSFTVNIGNISSVLSEDNKESFDNQFENFKKLVKKHFIKYAKDNYQANKDEKTQSGELNIDYIIDKIMKKIDIIFTINSDFKTETLQGKPSQLFVATEEHEWESPFTVDAPWTLKTNRLELDNSFDKSLEPEFQSGEWNSILSELISYAYSIIMKNIIQNQSLFNLTLSQLYSIMNDYKVITKHQPHHSLPPRITRMDVDKNLIQREWKGFFFGNVQPSEEFIQLWKHIVQIDDKDTLNWLNEAIDPQITCVILQDGTKLPIKNEHFPENSDLPEINSNYGNGIPKAIIDWINENPESQSILARVGKKYGSTGLTFIPQNAQILSGNDEVEFDFRGNFKILFDNIEVSRKTDKNQDNYLDYFYTLDEDVLDFNSDVTRDQIIGVNYHKAYDELIDWCFSEYSHNESEELDSLLELIFQQRPEQIFSDYIIVKVDESHYKIDIPGKNENLGFLIGDNAEAIPYATSCITTPIPRIIPRRRLNFSKWGQDIDYLPFAYIYDESCDWWEQLFSFADKSLLIDEKLKEKDLTNRSTFGTEYLHQTAHCRGGWRPCNTGLNEVQVVELQKRLRPFMIDSFIPHDLAHQEGRPQNQSQLASFNLIKGLRRRIPGTGVKNEEPFEQIKSQQAIVKKTIKKRKKILLKDGRKIYPGIGFEFKKSSLGLPLSSKEEENIRFKPTKIVGDGILAQPIDSKLHLSSIISINGPSQVILNNIRNCQSLQDRVNLFNDYNDYLTIINPPNKGARNTDDFCEAFDVVYGRNSTNDSDFTLFSWRISNKPPADKPVRVNDDDTDRILGSNVFDFFRDLEIAPFFKTDFDLDLISVLTHAEHEYLPYCESWGEKPQFSGIEFLQLNEQNLTTLSEVQSGKRNIFKNGVKKLLESLHHETYEVRSTLLYLSSLFNANIFDENILNETYYAQRHKTVCKKKLQQSSVEDTTKFFTLLVNSNNDNYSKWDDFEKNVFYHNDKDTLLQEFNEVALRVVSFENDSYQYTFDPNKKLDMLFTGEKIPFFSFEEFEAYKQIDEHGNIFKIKGSHLVMKKNVREKLKKLDANFDKIYLYNSLIKVEDIDHANSDDWPKKLSYMEEQFDCYIENCRTSYKRMEVASDFSDDFVENPQIVLFVEKSDHITNIVVSSRPDLKFTIDQHVWLLDGMKKKLERMGITVQKHKADKLWYPWSWTGNQDDDRENEGRLKFVMDFCQIATLEQLFVYDKITTLDQLTDHLDQIAEWYANNDQKLNYTIAHAMEHYKGMQTIRTTKNLFTNHNFEHRLDKQVSIPLWMLGVKKEDGSQSLGKTLLVSQSEVLTFRKFTKHHPDEEAYDLSDEAREIIWNRLIKEGESGWFGGEAMNHLFTFEGLLVDSNGDNHNACLWRVHALHILAYLQSL
jgi:hypothetical protein